MVVVLVVVLEKLVLRAASVGEGEVAWEWVQAGLDASGPGCGGVRNCPC